MTRIDNRHPHSPGIESQQPTSEPPPRADAKAPRPAGAQPSESSLARQHGKSHERSVIAFAKGSPSNRYEATKRELEQHPERADQLIAARLRGRSAADRDIVAMTLARSGNKGLLAYAQAERALAKLGAFSSPEREDIRAFMRTGESLDRAIADERVALGAPVKYEPTQSGSSAPAALLRQAVANVHAETKHVEKLDHEVVRLMHAVGSLSRKAEVAAGVGSAMGTVGSTAFAIGESGAKLSTKPLEKALNHAGDAGELIMGGLTGRIAAADQTARAYRSASGRYHDAAHRFENAARAGDYPGMTRAREQMSAAKADMTRQLERLSAQAGVIQKWNVKFGDAATEMVIETAMFAISAGKGFHELAKPVVGAVKIGGDMIIDAIEDHVVTAGVNAARDSEAKSSE